jgi:hypothetical protein
MLILYDAELQYINPFDLNLSPEFQHRVHAEIVRNYWYFLREIVRIDVPGGTTSFEFNRGNLALSWLIHNNINSYTEIPRQTFKTGTISTRIAYVWAFGSRNSKCSFLANTPETVKGNLERVKIVLRNLPWYLQMLNERKDTSNKESLVSATTNNLIVVRNPPSNEQQAMNKGRGSTEETQWMDEVPHTKHIKTIILNSASSWGKARTFAAGNNVPYARIFSSTPGILGTESGDYIYSDMLPQCVPFDEKLFYDQPDLASLNQLVTDQSKNDVVYIRFTYKQLGFGEEYLARQYRDLQNDKESIEREVLLKWARRSNDSPFTVEQLNRVYNHLKAPIGTITIRNTYVLKFYEIPITDKKYVISVDCSGMLENDYSSVTITDPQTFAVVATLRSNARTAYSNTTSFTYALVDIMRMFMHAILIIEKNNMGIAIIDSVMTLAPDLVDRMYSSDLEPNQKAINSGNGYIGSDNINLRKDFKRTMVYGFDTNQARRNQMFSELLGIIINELYDVIRDHDIYIELNNIIRNNKGRLDHRQGKHDDLLFSYLIGLWVLCYSKILNERYDYPFGYIRPMSLVDDNTKRIEEADTIDSDIDISEEAIKIYKANSIPPNNILQQISFTFEKPNIDTRESREDSIDTPGRNMSYADIADVIFGSDESLIDLTETNTMDDVEFDDNVAEDMHQKMSAMNMSERESFKQKQFEEFDKTVMTAKMTKAQSLEKARNVRKQKILKERLGKAMPEGMSDETLDSIIDAFLP